MNDSTVRFTSFPRTEQPPYFVEQMMEVFMKHEEAIGTENKDSDLTSDMVLARLQPDLISMGFQIEKGNQKEDRIERPVFFGEDGKPTLMYRVDAYNDEWRCGLEVEASRGWLSNAIYRDLVQASVMVDVDHLVVAVANRYVYSVKGRQRTSYDYRNVVELANALYGHTRLPLPYGLTVIGY